MATVRSADIESFIAEVMAVMMMMMVIMVVVMVMVTMVTRKTNVVVTVRDIGGGGGGVVVIIIVVAHDVNFALVSVVVVVVVAQHAADAKGMSGFGVLSHSLKVHHGEHRRNSSRERDRVTEMARRLDKLTALAFTTNSPSAHLLSDPFKHALCPLVALARQRDNEPLSERLRLANYRKR